MRESSVRRDHLKTHITSSTYILLVWTRKGKVDNQNSLFGKQCLTGGICSWVSLAGSWRKHEYTLDDTDLEWESNTNLQRRQPGWLLRKSRRSHNTSSQPSQTRKRAVGTHMFQNGGRPALVYWSGRILSLAGNHSVLFSCFLLNWGLSENVLPWLCLAEKGH